jgi:hypothetical protein
MKKTIHLLLLLISGISFSQTILVPYRKGQLWGFADTLGKQVCEAKYDQVYFKNELRQFDEVDFPENYFIIKKGNKTGVFSDKEIIPPQFEKIRCVDKSYFACSDQVKGIAKYWFALDGTSLMPKGYEVQSLIGKFDYDYVQNRSRYYCFIVKAENATYGIYYFDTQTPKRSRFLIKDCYRIKYERDEPTQEMELVIDLSINVSKAHGHLRYNKEKEEIVLYYESAKEYSNRIKELQNSSYEESPGEEMMVEAPPVIAEADGNNSTTKNVETPIQVYMRGYFKLKLDTLTLEMVNARFVRTGKTYMTEMITLPEKAEKIKLINYLGYGSLGVRKSDSLFQYSNYVTFKLGDKKGLLARNKATPFYADSILQIKTEGYNETGYSFLFGQKDKTGKMLFGWITAEGKEMIPALYEDIQFKNSYFAPEFNYASSKWIVKKSGKVGMIRPDGKVLIDTQYDEIKLMGTNYASPIYRLLKKDGKYGLYYLENEGIYTGNEWILMEPFTPYRITSLCFIPRGKEKNKNYYTLYRLEDEAGNFMGYRSRSGREFFEN